MLPAKRAAQKVINKATSLHAAHFPVSYWLSVAKNFKNGVVEFYPDKDTPFYADDHPIALRLDTTIFPYAIAKSYWQIEDITAILERIDTAKTYQLIDIGANIGLYSRQILAKLGQNISCCICFEPEEKNFALLEKNLAPYSSILDLRKVALSDQNGVAEFFIDPSNCGHNSLSSDAFRSSAEKVSISVPTADTGEISKGLLDQLPLEEAFIVKMDTEGFDEQIATYFPDSFWARVDICAMEISCVEKPGLNWNRLETILSDFDQREWIENPGRNLTVPEILTFAKRKDFKFRNLIMSRKNAG